MATKLFLPNPNQCANAEVGIVLVNHAGSTISQDAGRDAQALAINLGTPVIAAERPGTGGHLPRPALKRSLTTSAGYVQETVQIARRIDEMADQYDLKRLVLAGRSAGGLGALALARTEIISSAQYLFAAEPAGCVQVYIEEGIQKYKDYSVHQKQLQQTEERILVPPKSALPRLQAARRIAAIVKNVYYDQYHNGNIWASNAATDFAHHIAEHQTDVAATISFAEFSLVLDDRVYASDWQLLNQRRSGGAPFVVNSIKHTTHASFDDRKLFAELVRPMVEAAAQA